MGKINGKKERVYRYYESCLFFSEILLGERRETEKKIVN